MKKNLEKFLQCMKHFYDHNLNYVLGYILVITFIIIAIVIIKESISYFRFTYDCIGGIHYFLRLEIAIAIMYFALNHKENK